MPENTKIYAIRRKQQVTTQVTNFKNILWVRKWNWYYKTYAITFSIKSLLKLAELYPKEQMQKLEINTLQATTS